MPNYFIAYLYLKVQSDCAATGALRSTRFGPTDNAAKKIEHCAPPYNGAYRSQPQLTTPDR